MSDKPGKSSFLPKAIVIVVALAAIAYGVVVYMRPTAKVETVVSGTAVDAKPGSVTVKEEYSMQMKAAIGGRILSKDYKLDTGLKVKEGDILVQLDTGDVEIEIQQAENEYESS